MQRSEGTNKYQQKSSSTPFPSGACRDIAIRTTWVIEPELEDDQEKYLVI